MVGYRTLDFYAAVCSFRIVFGSGVLTELAKGEGSTEDCMKIFGLGMPELIIILLVVLLIFGPKQLPKLGRAMGKTIKGLRAGAEEVQEGLKGDVDDSKEEEPEEEDAEEAADEAPKKVKKVVKKKAE